MNLKKLEEKELKILRYAVDKASEQSSSQIAQSDKVKNIMAIVEKFLYDKKLICYGGIAINNILPLKDQFYNRYVDVPDYDFFSPNALNDAMKLADIYYKKGYSNVQAKTGIHEGTFKVYVDSLQVADITQIPKNLFNNLKKDSVSVYGILYAPVNFLRMSMYLELSRPKGDVSRWEKVLKRLILLNKNYPIKYENCEKEINIYNKNKNHNENLFNIIKDTAINTELVFFGSYAVYLYSKYMPNYIKKKFKKTLDFNILSNNPLKSVILIKERLNENGIKNVKYYKKKGVGEIIPEHYEIKVNNKTVGFIYKTFACHNYNKINLGDKIVKVATIDTILSLYFAFMYGDRSYYDVKKLTCITQFLFIVQYENRLNQKGLLKRFVLSCYGKQESMDDKRLYKSEQYNLLKDKKDSYEFKKLFLKYYPDQSKSKNKTKNVKKNKTKNVKKNKTKNVTFKIKNKRKNKTKSKNILNKIIKIL